jgi:NAD(P)-dependent dehydrogenase (short-subunit alcohol dehydrogenase family)
VSQLEGKIALVTGAGARGGIGFQVAKGLIREGATVIISGRDTERGEATARELGNETRFILADLSDIDSVRALAEQVDHLDILVNNAGTLTIAPTTGQSVEEYDRVFATNVRGPYFLTAALAPKIASGGSIINISTMAAQHGAPGASVYSASKAAVESLTRTWAAEFAPAGVRVNTISPGTTASEKVLAAIGEAANAMAQLAPLARIADPVEIAEAVIFLATPKASYITGAYIPVDGGRAAV